MAARGGVIDTSAFKGIADLHAEVLSNDSVVAPAHEVVQDSDLIADSSMPPAHAEAAPEHSGDTAATSTEDATAGDTGHVHADLAYADVEHAYADHAVADVDHAYADHAYADAAVPDSAFADHSILAADDGTPHSFGADAAKGQDDGNNAAAWWWVGGAALAAGAIGYWAGDDHHDDNSTSSVAGADVHVVVERDGAFIDTNANGVHDEGETTAAVFGSGGTAALDGNSVTVHFNDVPLHALDLTGFGADDKIEFHVEQLINHDVVANNTVSGQIMQHVNDLSVNPEWPDLAFAFMSGDGPFAGNGESMRFHQHTGKGYDFAGNSHLAQAGYLDAEYLVASIASTVGSATVDGGVNYYSTTHGVIAYWNDAGNALNNNAHMMPNFVGTVIGTTTGGTQYYTNGNTATVVANFNNNNEGGVVDFIWPSGAPIPL